MIVKNEIAYKTYIWIFQLSSIRIACCIETCQCLFLLLALVLVLVLFLALLALLLLVSA